MPPWPRSLLALYRDIEITDRHNTFYEKFSTRYQASASVGAWLLGRGNTF